jgi:4-hydroxy-tetrahydrodipicolinate synthase
MGDSRTRRRPSGVLLPLITPFYKGSVDLQSIDQLVARYLSSGIDGLVLFGTTGESPTVSTEERIQVVTHVVRSLGGKLPVWVGISGNSTQSVVDELRLFDDLDLEGYLVTVPYYSRPPADGIVSHFTAVCGATERSVLLYNIPYRTGVNVLNAMLLGAAAEIENLVGVKDSSGDDRQSTELIFARPDNFSVLTGEDEFYFYSQCAGGDGGILASAHVRTRDFVDIGACVRANNLHAARGLWRPIAGVIKYLFAESNPMPLKYILSSGGLIRSQECRLPMTRISDELAAVLDDWKDWLLQDSS